MQPEEYSIGYAMQGIENCITYLLENFPISREEAKLLIKDALNIIK